MQMSAELLLNIVGAVIGFIMTIIVLRAGIGQAREFQKLTGDDSAIVSVLALQRGSRAGKRQADKSRRDHGIAPAE